MEFILGIAIGGAAVWFGKDHIKRVFTWIKEQIKD